MALTYTLIKGSESVTGRTREYIYDVLLDNSYTAGGYTIVPDDVGMVSIFGAEVVGASLSNGAAQTTTVYIQYDPLLGKLQAFESGAANAALAEKNEATGLSTTIVRIKFIGI